MRIWNCLYLLLFALLVSCGADSFSGKMDEGTVEYDIIYLQDEKENPLISLLPTTMTFKFKDGRSVQRIEGWMGIFQMAGIADRDENYTAALLKIMNEKYVYESTLDGPSFGFDPMGTMRIEQTDSTKMIAGIKAKKANVYLDGSSTPAFAIYWTDNFDLEKPNIHNPFREIDGVLLEYQYVFQKIPMRLTATKVIKEEITDEEFNIPDGFSKVPMEKMQETISNLM